MYKVTTKQGLQFSVVFFFFFSLKYKMHLNLTKDKIDGFVLSLLIL